jgi:hypothetical protein
MAARCASEAIAKKFEALANDYEEHARRAGKGQVIVDLSGPDGAKPDGAKTHAKSDAPDTIEPSNRGA